MSQLSALEIDVKTKLLRATFLNNMAVFNKYMPEISNFFQNYTPTRAKLTFDHNGDINMVSEGSLVYEDKAKESSYKQADLFFDEPKLFSYQISNRDRMKYTHEHVLEDIYQLRKQDFKTAKFNLLKHEKHIDLLTMIGVGLGFHIERLFQLSDVRYFYLFEPDPDCFYCAMHCVDFGPMIEHCFSNGGAFTIRIGGNANQYINGLNEVLTNQGFFNVARFFNYRHYRSEMTDKTFQTVYELAYRLSSGWGFFEDEIISIIHTLSNAKEQFPYILGKNFFDNKLKDKPVFIVGNGPSLDDSIEFIKENANNVVVLSCGTALKPVLDAGITPDFHIEMERSAELYKWVDAVGHKEKLKQINVIALNTVYTKILKLFKNAYLLAKPKDGGTDFLYQYIDKDRFPPVDGCNPTVSNAAVSAAIYLGFKNLYLFGVDLGFIDEEHHHSKSSIYYQKGSHAERKEMKGDMTVKGNFTEEVFTTQHFDNSRSSIEILLEKNPDVNCYNCSNGAYIQLTKPLQIEEISDLILIDEKERLLTNLLRDSFSYEEFKQLNLNTLFKEKLVDIKRAINVVIEQTSVDVTSRQHLAQLFSSQYKFAKSFQSKKETAIVYRFLSGTLNYFQSNIMTNAYMYKDKEKQLSFINAALGMFHEHLLWLFDTLEQGYDKPSKK